MKLSFSFKQLVRVIAGVYLCALVFLAIAVPAFANTNVSTKGEEQMPKIQLKSLKVVESDPYSAEKTQYEANKGINEVQGDADKDKMYNPANTDGPASAEQIIGRTLEAAKDKTDRVASSTKEQFGQTADGLRAKADTAAEKAKAKATHIENDSNSLTEKVKNLFQ